MNDLQKLRELFLQQLSRGPFPTNDCARANFDLDIHGDLVIYLANIAGIASRGQRLKEVDVPTRASFRASTAAGWWEKHPETTAAVNALTTPRLYELISASEEARLIILKELNR
jgi:hypothetical protein